MLDIIGKEIKTGNSVLRGRLEAWKFIGTKIAVDATTILLGQKKNTIQKNFNNF